MFSGIGSERRIPSWASIASAERANPPPKEYVDNNVSVMKDTTRTINGNIFFCPI
jgi:hypothetical protein